MPTAPSVAIVMPAYNAATFLARSLPAAIRAANGSEVIVVDPASTDGTGDIARSLGAKVIRLPERQGPAGARNAGVAATSADVVLFIDADCVAKPDVVERVRAAFSDPALATLTGSYCDDPPEHGFFSLYMNLRHHHTHQVARRDEATFWAGCGAVRRSLYQRVGGFDTARFPRPMIEDIELGLRLREHGATRLDPDLQVTHLKRWSGRNVIVTDIACRAVPWTRLIIERGMPNDLNLRLSQRVAALVAPFALASFVAAPTLAIIGHPIAALFMLVPLALAFMLSRGLVTFFARRRGLWFALRGLVFHQIHLIYSAATFVIVTLACRFTRREMRSSLT